MPSALDQKLHELQQLSQDARQALDRAVRLAEMAVAVDLDTDHGRQMMLEQAREFLSYYKPESNRPAEGDPQQLIQLIQRQSASDLNIL